MVFLCSKYKLNEINVDTDFLIKTLTQGFGLRNTNYKGLVSDVRKRV